MTLERLGFGPDERVVIIHADDLGMCHAANTAFADVVAAGTVACGSIMVPCPWFLEMAAYARSHPEADLGVHLTLTSEWNGYRWGPISTRDRASGLLDEQGYLWPDVASLLEHMHAEAAVREMRAQMERALGAGVDVTHIDTHMGSVVHPALTEAYIGLGLEYGLPVMLPRLSREALLARGLPAPVAEALRRAASRAEESGRLFLIDHITDLDDAVAMRDPISGYRDLLASLPPGLTHLIYHAASDTEEARAVMGDAAAARRVIDWRTMSAAAFREVLAESGVRSIGYRDLRRAMRE